MKNKSQINTAPLNRAADLLAEKHTSFSDKSWKPAWDALKTARQLRAPFVPEIHMIGGGSGADAIGELFRACGWIVIYEPDTKLEKGHGRRLQPRKPSKPKCTKGRLKVR